MRIIAVALVLIVLGTIGAALPSMFILNKFEALEETEFKADLSRAMNAMDRDIGNVSEFAMDYSMWDYAYN